MQVTIRLADVCNLKCRMCPFWSVDKQNRSEPMSLENFGVILDKLKNSRIYGQRIDAVRLDGNREGLCYPQIDIAVRMAKEKGFSARLISNAVLLAPSISENLLLAGIDSMEFSVSGITPQTYARFQGYNMPEWQFEKVCNNIKEFINLKNKIRPSCLVTIHILIDREFSLNADECRMALNFWRNIGCDRVGVANELPPPPPPLERAIGSTLCAKSPIISTDGSVSLCCGGPEELTLGNLLKDEPADIFSGDAAVSLYRALNNPKKFKLPEECKGCQYNWIQERHTEEYMYDANIEDLSIANHNFKHFIQTSQGKRVFILGSGEMARSAIEECNSVGITVEGIIDNDFRKWGNYVNGIPVIEPDWPSENISKEDRNLLICIRNISDAIRLADKWGYVHIYAYGLFFEQAYKRYPAFLYYYNFA